MQKTLSLLLLLMLCCPFSIMWLKLLLLFIIIFNQFFKYVSGHYICNYKKKYVIWFFLFFCSGLFSLLYGAIKGNPGVHYHYLVYLAWPILYPVVFSNLNIFSIRKLEEMLNFCYLFILITGVLSFLQMNFGLFTFFDPTLFGYEIADNSRPMYLFISPSGGAIVDFFILFSFMLSNYCLSEKRLSIRRIILLLLGFVYIVISSRRVMMFGFIYIPIILMLLTKLSKQYVKHKLRNRIFMIYTLPLICLFLGIGYVFADTEDFSLFFSSAFSSDGDFGRGENVRLDQGEALIKGWYDNFFFGAGTGINASVVRNDIPGVYELSYHAILFERGLFGSILYFGLLLIPIVWTVKIVKACKNIELSSFLLSYSVCYISLLSANATNPYIGAFDYIWIIFLYIALINNVDKIIDYEKSMYNY